MADATTTRKRTTTPVAPTPPVEGTLGGAASEVAVAAALTPLEASVAEGLAEVRHKRGCPAKDLRAMPEVQGEGNRIEVIEHRVSGRGLDADRGGGTDGTYAVVVRCVECGEQYPDD